MSNGTAPAAGGALEPRLCHVIKVDSFDGYGFNLHAEKGKPGQFIGKVDEGSPAETAGLKQGDRIIEVNGVNIANENHKQVVQRIKTLPDQTRLLVVTPGPHEEIPNLEVPEVKTKTENNNATAPTIEDSNKNEIKAEEATKDVPDSNDNNVHENNVHENNLSSAPKLNLGMTAAEMRAKLAAKKKVDPKKVAMDLKSKFDIVQKL